MIEIVIDIIIKIIRVIVEYAKTLIMSRPKAYQAHHQSINVIPQSRLTSKREHKKIVSIFCNHTYNIDNTFSTTGLESKDVGCSYFLDLFGVCTRVEDRMFLCVLLNKVMKEVESQTGRFDFIAVPKLGNVLLVDSLSRLSGKPLLVVRHQAIKFNNPIEGDMQAGKNVLVADDIGSDGKFIHDVVLALQLYGARVQSVICLVNRNDGNAEKYLTEKKISYFYLYNINDDALRRMII